MSIRAAVAKLVRRRGRDPLPVPSRTPVAGLRAPAAWQEPFVLGAPSWSQPRQPGSPPPAPVIEAPAAVPEPVPEDAAPSAPPVEPAPRPYVGRRRSPGVMLGFSDGSELELAAAEPSAQALRDLATALTSRG